MREFRLTFGSAGPRWKWFEAYTICAHDTGDACSRSAPSTVFIVGTRR